MKVRVKPPVTRCPPNTVMRKKTPDVEQGLILPENF